MHAGCWAPRARGERLALPAHACRAVEELVPLRRSGWAFGTASACIRTALLGLCLATALVVPFFSLVMALIGAVLSMSISIVLPCVFYLRICRPALGAVDVVLCSAAAVFGVAAGSMATYQALADLAGQL